MRPLIQKRATDSPLGQNASPEARPWAPPLSFREQEIVLKAKLRDQLTLRDGKWNWAIKLDNTTVHLAHYLDGRPSWSFNPYRTVTEAREAFEELIVAALRRGYLPLPNPVPASAPPPARTPIERGHLEDALRVGRALLVSGPWTHELSWQGLTVRRGFGKGSRPPATVDQHPSAEAARLAFARAVLAALHEGYRPPGPMPWTAPAHEAPGAEVRLLGRAVTVAVRRGLGAVTLDRALGELHRAGGERLTLLLQAGVDPAAVVEGLRASGLPGWARGLCLFAFEQPGAFEEAFLDASPLALAAVEHRLQHLKSLRVDHCALSAAGRQELERLGGYVEAKGQAPGSLERYVPSQEQGGFVYLPG